MNCLRAGNDGDAADVGEGGGDVNDIPGMSSDQAMRIVMELFRRAAASGMDLQTFLLHEQVRTLQAWCEELQRENESLRRDKELDAKAREQLKQQIEKLKGTDPCVTDR